MNQKQIVVLIGPRCSGKSSVGRVLAAMLDLPWRDTDAMVTLATGLSPADFIIQNGWDAFRQLESALLGEALDAVAESGGVVCPGGGAVLAQENRLHMQRGLVIYLKAPLPVLLSRLATGEEKEARPPLMGSDSASEFEQVLAFREPLYQQLATYTVDAAPKVELVAAAIVRLLA